MCPRCTSGCVERGPYTTTARRCCTCGHVWIACEACWAPFPDQAELAKHVQMEEAVDWPIQTEEPTDA